MDTQLANKIVNIVAQTKRLKPEQVRVDATFDELGIDSLDRIQMLFEMESAFNIDIPDEEARGIKTVREMVERMEAYFERVQRKGA